MIHLEHLNLVVRNLEETLKFYQAAFPEWSIRGSGDQTWYGKPRKWLHFGDEYQYLTFNDNGEGENRDLKGHQIGLAHFAFITHNLEQLTKRLSLAGFHPHNLGSDSPYRKNHYFIDPNDYEIEFTEYLSDLPSQRNQYDD